METIRRKICFEKSRSRRQGLLPYIPFNVDVSALDNPFTYPTSADTNGNYGGFVANVSQDDYVNIYCDLILKYNKICNILNKGLKLKRVDRLDEESGYYVNWILDYDEPLELNEYFIVSAENLSKVKDGLYRWTSDEIEPIYERINAVFDYDYIVKCNYGNVYDFTSVYEFMEYMNNFIGEISVPIDIEGSLVPEKIALPDILSNYNWMSKNSGSTDCCILKEWKERGGADMLEFLEDNLDTYQEKLEYAATFVDSGKTDTIPWVNFPILLTSNFNDLGLYTTCYSDEFLRSGGTREDEKMIDITGESKLQTLRKRVYDLDDEGNALPGILVKIDEEERKYQYYKKDNGSWVECFEDVPNYVRFKLEPPDSYGEDGDYVLVTHVNGSDVLKRMKIPYQTGLTFNNVAVKDENDEVIIYENCYLYQGDFITNIDTTSLPGYILFEYTIGGQYKANVNNYDFVDAIPNTGIKYKEVYPYEEVATMTATLDGCEYTLYYEKIDFDTTKIQLTHELLNLSIDGYKSNIVGYVKDDIWKESGATVDAPIYKEDYLMPCSIEVQSDIDITVSRGNAAAFEKHYKMSECNTFDDLKNYSNNFFNL